MDYLWLYDLLFIAGYLARRPLNLQSFRDTILYIVVQKKSQLLPIFSLIYVSPGRISEDGESERERQRQRQRHIYIYRYI